MRQHHENFEVHSSGLWLSTSFPFIGASPDAISSCSCHGKSTVEIKCPWRLKDKVIVDAIEENIDVGIERTPAGLTVKKNHTYWYQVQTQLYCTGLDRAHFVCWCPMDIYIGVVDRDIEFMDNHLNVLSTYFKNLILPELMAKYFTRPHVKVSSSDILHCYCRGSVVAEFDLQCQNLSCVYKKFHMQCLGLKRKPSVNKIWYCPQCRKGKS